MRNQIMKIPSYRNKMSVKNMIDEFIPISCRPGIFAVEKHIDHEKNIQLQIKNLTQMKIKISDDMKFWLDKLFELAMQNDIKIYFARSAIHESMVNNKMIKEKLYLLNSKINLFLSNYSSVIQINNNNPIFYEEHSNGDMDHVNEKGRRYLTRLYSRLIVEKM